jgi:hypothetical protein
METAQAAAAPPPPRTTRSLRGTTSSPPGAFATTNSKSKTSTTMDRLFSDHDIQMLRSLSSGTSYDGLQACANTADSDGTDSDKYFWMSLVDNNNNVLNGCLVSIPTGQDSGCCTMPGSTNYSTDYNLVVADPATVVNTTSQAYAVCGKDGGPGCPTYNYDTNEQGFGEFEIQDSDGNTLRNPDKYVNGGAKCGLTDQLGTCGSGTENVWGHIHVGAGYCLQSAISLEHYCDGHYGYKCLDGTC